MTSSIPYDHLEALERRGDRLEQFADCQRQANEEIKKNGTDSLVKELRQARSDRRPIKLGTINTLILLEHIDRLEELVVQPRVTKP